MPLSLNFIVDADPESLSVNEYFIIQNDDGSSITTTPTAIEFELIDAGGNYLLRKTLSNGIAWNPTTATITLQIKNKDLAFASNDVSARYAIWITWDSNVTEKIVPAAPADYDFATISRIG